MEDKLDIIIQLLTEINSKLSSNQTVKNGDINIAIKPKKLTKKQQLHADAILLAEHLGALGKKRAEKMFTQKWAESTDL